MSRDSALSELREQIGKEIDVSEWLVVDQGMINSFADATRDQQWIHTDPERAEVESPYQTTIAHGFFTLSLIPYLTGSVNPDKPRFPGIKMSINYGLNKVRFPNAVPANARIRTRTTLLSADPVKDNAIQAVRKVMVDIDGQDKPACVAEMVSRYYF